MRFRFPYKKKAASSKNTKRMFTLPFAALFIIISTSVFLVRLDMALFPIALQAAEVLARARINEVINEATISAIEGRNLVSEDFYNISIDDDGRLNTLSLNTVLINYLSNEIAVAMSRELAQKDIERIEIPYGALTGIRVLANFGPRYAVYLQPMGDVVVDYSSSFSSVGINQVNFQVWLNINTRMSIINPLQSNDVTLERRVPLVNAVINADIPNVFLGSPPDSIIIPPPPLN